MWLVTWPKRRCMRFWRCLLLFLCVGAGGWLLCRPTTVLAQSSPPTPLLQNMEQLWHWGGSIDTLTPVSDTLYAGMGKGLVLLDTKEPATPKLLGQLSLNATIYDIKIVGAYALLATADKGLLIVDVSDKHAPRLVANHLASHTIKSIAVAAPYAYIAYWNKIAILDVTHPEAPTVITPEMAGIANFDPESLQIANGYLFVAGGKFEVDRYSYHTWGALQAFRLTDPSVPTPLPAYRTEVGIASDKQLESLHLQGDSAYAAQGDSIMRFTISTPATITLSSQLHLKAVVPTSLTVLGTQLYIAKRTWRQGDADGLYILDASSTSTITVSSFLPQLVNKLAAQGNYAFIGRDDGLHVWDVSKPLTPHEIGSYRMFVSIGDGDLVARALFLYATGGLFGTPLLSTIDLHKPDAPSLTTVITGIAYSAFYPFVDGNWLLVPTRSASGPEFGAIQLFNIIDPSAPQHVARYATSPFTTAAYANHRLYMEKLQRLRPSGQINVFNFAEPTMPLLDKTIQTAPQKVFVNFNDLGLNERYLYYIGSNSDQYPTLIEPYYLYVYDLAKDQVIGSLEIPWTYSIYLYGDTLYGISSIAHAGCPYTIYMVDVAEPSAPHIRQTYCWPKWITDLLVDGNLLYIADKSEDYFSDRNPGGLSVVDFTMPHAPALAGYAIETGNTPQLAKLNDTLYFLDNGLSAYRYRPPQAARRLELGGQLVAAVDPVTYTFPAAAFATPVTVTHTTHFADPWLAFAAPRFGVGHAFSLESKVGESGEAIQPTGAFSLTVTYTDEATQHVDEATLALYRWVDGAWVVEKTSSVDPATNTVVASPTATGLWMLGAMARHQMFLPLIGR